jgi:hypothetical protein
MPPKRKVVAEEKVAEVVASPIAKKAKKANSVTIEHCKQWSVAQLCLSNFLSWLF